MIVPSWLLCFGEGSTVKKQPFTALDAEGHPRAGSVPRPLCAVQVSAPAAPCFSWQVSESLVQGQPQPSIEEAAPALGLSEHSPQPRQVVMASPFCPTHGCALLPEPGSPVVSRQLPGAGGCSLRAERSSRLPRVPGGLRIQRADLRGAAHCPCGGHLLIIPGRWTPSQDGMENPPKLMTLPAS